MAVKNFPIPRVNTFTTDSSYETIILTRTFLSNWENKMIIHCSSTIDSLSKILIIKQK